MATLKLSPEVTIVVMKMRVLINREYNVKLELDEAHYPECFVLYAMKSANLELRTLADNLLVLCPELQRLLTLVDHVEGLRTHNSGQDAATEQSSKGRRRFYRGRAIEDGADDQ
ncbi:MAG: hypothetical protein ACFCBW_08775 [Candidatus Competibacterales bacterium]